MERINSVGITLGEGDFCISVFVGDCPVYLHGAYADLREFGNKIIEAADLEFAASAVTGGRLLW
jgi:hypothetical protein